MRRSQNRQKSPFYRFFLLLGVAGSLAGVAHGQGMPSEHWSCWINQHEPMIHCFSKALLDNPDSSHSSAEQRLIKTINHQLSQGDLDSPSLLLIDSPQDAVKGIRSINLYAQPENNPDSMERVRFLVRSIICSDQNSCQVDLLNQ